MEPFIKHQLTRKKILLMTHCVVGYPSLEANWTMLEAFEDAGVDFVELQLPFSEPMADGPVFVKANEKALKNGITPDIYFDFLSRVTARFSFKVYFMGYYNPVFKMGPATFCKRLSDAGAVGFIIPDLPLEENKALTCEAEQCGLVPTLFFTPMNSEKRLEEIAKRARGFIYCVPRKGVTGHQSDTAAIDSLLALYREKAGSTPLGVGFGITRPEDIQNLIGKVDIAIIGTQLLRQWESDTPEAFRHYVNSLATEGRTQ